MIWIRKQCCLLQSVLGEQTERVARQYIICIHNNFPMNSNHRPQLGPLLVPRSRDGSDLNYPEQKTGSLFDFH